LRGLSENAFSVICDSSSGALRERMSFLVSSAQCSPNCTAKPISNATRANLELAHARFAHLSHPSEAFS
jgi:hypothetical protein